MDYRRTSLAANRQHQASVNSHIYASFAGSGPNRQPNGNIYDIPTTMWWDDERIDATVDRQFVLSKLRPDEQLRLDEPLGFGDSLTDDTYMEWIELKAKRMFLILVDLDVPDQIFGIIDDSWDDDDLPVPLNQIERLQLTPLKDEKLESRFFQRQFIYLLRNVLKGEHEYYDDEEVVPLELAEKRPVGAVAGLIQSNVEKVHLPGRPDDLFVRRRIPLGTASGCLPQEELLSGLETMRSFEHDHIMSLWASYSHKDNAYLLLTPVNESSLKSFLNVTPPSIKILAKQDRRILMLNWIHCLADAISFLHRKGLAHKAIKPSNVLLDIDNHIFFSNSSIFGGEKPGFDKETYDYQAPEQLTRPPSALSTSRPDKAGRCTIHLNAFGFSVTQKNILATNDDSSIYASSSTCSTSSASSSTPSINPTVKYEPQQADIYSLGAIFLEIITLLMKRTSRNFASHRSSKNKTPGRGGGQPDASFHKNPRQVESWMTILAQEGKKKEDKIFRSVSHILALIKKMMSANPGERPNAYDVQENVYCILIEYCGLGPSSESPGRIHCTAREREDNGWNFGFDQLRLASQRAAAEACANVNPVTANQCMMSATGAMAYSIERATPVVSSVAWSPGPSSPTVPISPGFVRMPTRDADMMSVSSGNKSRSSDGKSGSGSTSLASGMQGGKAKARSKAWQAPIYAGSYPSTFILKFWKRLMRLGMKANGV
ncbi:hypothetical protein QTJ16_000682 [Diplocarpon rosae]|uniref:Protein kinase domain-containing protein n=1 Tax=Diplocarpon rosae TaxID=946125 RepID=A0AAD9T6D1_9HELO|nr:hypothetical protein QTJ16_000682 [Diplocarpon rosae]